MTPLQKECSKAQRHSCLHLRSGRAAAALPAAQQGAVLSERRGLGHLRQNTGLSNASTAGQGDSEAHMSMESLKLCKDVNVSRRANSLFFWRATDQVT